MFLYYSFFGFLHSCFSHYTFFAEHVDSDEAKAFFEANYSHIFYILHETFVQAETNLKQKGELPERYLTHSN